MEPVPLVTSDLFIYLFIYLVNFCLILMSVQIAEELMCYHVTISPSLTWFLDPSAQFYYFFFLISFLVLDLAH